MAEKNLSSLFSQDRLNKLFSKDRTGRFFEALYGSAEDGDYDIELTFEAQNHEELQFEFRLREKPGRCLRCSVTDGLTQVFSRHPVIDIQGMVKDINHILNSRARCTEWRVGMTREILTDLHVIPLTLYLDKALSET